MLPYDAAIYNRAAGTFRIISCVHTYKQMIGTGNSRRKRNSDATVCFYLSLPQNDDISFIQSLYKKCRFAP